MDFRSLEKKSACMSFFQWRKIDRTELLGDGNKLATPVLHRSKSFISRYARKKYLTCQRRILNKRVMLQNLEKAEDEKSKKSRLDKTIYEPSYVHKEDAIRKSINRYHPITCWSDSSFHDSGFWRFSGFEILLHNWNENYNDKIAVHQVSVHTVTDESIARWASLTNGALISGALLAKSSIVSS